MEAIPQNLLLPSLVDPISQPVSQHPPSVGICAENLSPVLMAHWYQKLALRTTELTASSLLRDQDGRRYAVLMAACRHQDFFYIKLHELSCLWSIDNTTVYQTFSFLATPDAIDFTFNELQRILNNNDLSPSDLQWFANFTWPAKTMITDCSDRTLIADMGRFIERFAALWQLLLDETEMNDHPIAATVLKDSMHCASPILRYILFVASSLHIGIVTGPDATSYDEQFEKDEGEGEGFSIPGETVREALAIEHAHLINRQLYYSNCN
ncbi:hypothetical protein FSARC_14924 [Fusarium sarcochroum]|uniref:Uncharacterized protein n=1 Tax=Fusarium sarcochroum TaxID=1208366 RepID=A0A8H4SPZ2_9HYPO|nr:hypothetical protein FSARC_14924 [Fusarium sarcochroum]